MGSPLGPILADIFMAKLEENELSTTISGLDHYVRYVDDTFVICNRRCSTRQILHAFNKCHENITFTVEEESSNCLAFLDVKVIRQPDDNITTKINHKKSWTGQYVNFSSFVPMTIKRNLVRNLFLRIQRLVSPEHVSDEEEHLTEVLMKNGYPKAFIVKNRHNDDTRTTNEADEQTKYAIIRLGFRGDGAAELLRQKLGRTIRNTCENVCPRVIFTSRTLIATQTRDRLNLMSTPNVIYQFTCSTCPVQYIGMTERRLGDRVREHLPLWLSHCTEKTSRSSITDHIIEHGHTCKADDCFKILYRARNRRLLRFVEAVAIKRNKPRLNVMKETDLRLQLPWS